MSHTKGPYRIVDFENNDGSKTLFIKQDKGKADFTGFIIAQMASKTDNDEGNARLFAAAPDLLEALEGLLSHAVSMYASGSSAIFAITKAEAAIARAKGEP